MEYESGNIIDNFILKRLIVNYDYKPVQIWKACLLGLDIYFRLTIINKEITNVGIELNQKLVIGGKDFYIREEVGSGTFGYVYRLEGETKNYVIKFFVVPDESIREYRFYKLLDGCPNIPKVYGNESISLRNFLIFQKMKCNIEKRSLKRMEALKIMKDISNALQFIHSKDIVHGDIKPANILLDTEGNAYLCDFTNSYLRKKTVDEIGTIWFRAPENCSKIGDDIYYEIDFPADIWALGVCFLVIFNEGSVPKIFKTNNSNELYKNIKDQDVINEFIEMIFILEEDKSYMELAKQMLNIDPDKRISAKGVYEGIDKIINSIMNPNYDEYITIKEDIELDENSYLQQEINILS